MPECVITVTGDGQLAKYGERGVYVVYNLETERLLKLVEDLIPELPAIIRDALEALDLEVGRGEHEPLDLTSEIEIFTPLPALSRYCYNAVPIKIEVMPGDVGGLRSHHLSRLEELLTNGIDDWISSNDPDAWYAVVPDVVVWFKNTAGSTCINVETMERRHWTPDA